MSGVSFTVNEPQLSQDLGALDRSAENPVAAYHAIGGYLVTSTRWNIERETAPDGTRWPRLSARTAARRINGAPRGYDHMLQVRGRLLSSITYAVLPDGVQWGTNIVYGRVHQLGGTIDMPERRATVRLRDIRTKGGGIRKRFASPARHKRFEERAVTIRGHQVRIPARSYLGVSAQDRQEISQIMADHLRGEAGL